MTEYTPTAVMRTFEMLLFLSVYHVFQ